MVVVNSSYAIFEELKNITNSVIVSFSTGKDSLVLLDLCKKYFDNIYVYFMYIVKGLEYFENKIKYAEERFNVKIKQYPHPELSRYLRNGVCTFDAYETPKISYLDIMNCVKQDFNCEWIGYGWKKTDSLQRRGYLSTLRLDGINDKSKTFYPISQWNDNMIKTYLKHNNIIIPKTNKIGQFEVNLTYNSLKFMKDNYNNDYNKILKQFPFAEAIIKRKEIYGNH